MRLDAPGSHVRTTVWRLCETTGVVDVHEASRAASSPGPAVHDDLVHRDFTADGADGCGSPTSPSTHRQGKLYFCAIKDVSRTGSSATRSMTA